MSENTYPQWQTAIREAQAKQAEINRAAKEQAEAEEHEQQIKAGANLAFVLKLLGVVLPAAPVSNPFTCDGFTFRLKDWDSSTWQYQDGSPQFMTRGSGADCDVKFTLFVSKPLPADVAPEDYDLRGSEVVVYWRRVDGDWQPEQAALADVLDEVQERFDVWHEEYLDKRASRAYALPQAATTEERLLSALRDLIREAQPEF